MQRVVNKYNDTTHSTIKMKPKNVNLSNEHIVKRIFNTYPVASTTSSSARFQVGDYVRISDVNEAFRKAYQANWSTGIYKIHKILNTKPQCFLLRETFHEKRILSKAYYGHELKHTKYKNIFLIERTLRSTKDHEFVKW